MTKLTNTRDLLQSTTDAIEKVIVLESKLHKSYEDLMINAKVAEVAGLNRPNMFPMIQGLKEQKDMLENLKFAVECNLNNSEKAKQDKWNECIKKIPQKDEFELEGINDWHISDFTLVPCSEKIHDKLFREEAYKLFASGFDLAFNTDYGVGNIRVSEDGFGFIIELWQNLEQKNLYKRTLDEVLDWIIYFYDNRRI